MISAEIFFKYDFMVGFSTWTMPLAGQVLRKVGGRKSDNENIHFLSLQNHGHECFQNPLIPITKTKVELLRFKIHAKALEAKAQAQG